MFTEVKLRGLEVLFEACVAHHELKEHWLHKLSIYFDKLEHDHSHCALVSFLPTFLALKVAQSG